MDLEGNPALANVEGELHVRGCSVFAGYFDNASANERVSLAKTIGCVQAISRS